MNINSFITAWAAGMWLAIAFIHPSWMTIPAAVTLNAAMLALGWLQFKKFINNA